MSYRSRKSYLFSPRKTTRNSSYRRSLYNLVIRNKYNNSTSSAKTKFENGVYAKIFKKIDENGYCLVDKPYGLVKNNLRNNYNGYVVYSVINIKVLRTYNNRKVTRKRNVLLLINYHDKSRFSIWRNVVLKKKNLETEIICLSNKVEKLGKRNRELSIDLKRSKRSDKRARIGLDKYKRLYKDLNKQLSKKRILTTDQICELIQIVNKKNVIRPLVNAFNSFIPEVTISNYGTSASSCGRKWNTHCDQKRENLNSKISEMYVQLLDDSGNKKGNVYCSVYGIVCEENGRGCVRVLDGFQLKILILPLISPPSKKGGILHQEYRRVNGDMNCCVYARCADSGKENDTFQDSITSTTHHQCWRLRCTTHRYHTAVTYVLLDSFRKQRKTGTSNAKSNFYSSFRKDLYDCFDFINSHYEELHQKDSRITKCCYTQTRIGKSFEGCLKLLKFIELFENDITLRDFIDEVDGGREFVYIHRQRNFRRELVSFLVVGEYTLKQVYILTQSYGGVNAPIMRIKLCQVLLFAKCIEKGKYLTELYNDFYENNQTCWKSEFNIELVNLMKKLGKNIQFQLNEYFAPWLIDLNHQISLIFDKQYARMLDNFLEKKKRLDSTDIDPFFGFHYGDYIPEFFQDYINNDDNLNSDTNMALCNWYAKIFLVRTNQIKCEQVLGRVNWERMHKPRINLNSISNNCFMKYSTLSDDDNLLTIDESLHDDIFNRVSSVKQVTVVDNWDELQWNYEEFDINVVEWEEGYRNFKTFVFYFDICEKHPKLRDIIHAKYRYIRDNLPELKYWKKILKKLRF